MRRTEPFAHLPDGCVLPFMLRLPYQRFPMRATASALAGNTVYCCTVDMVGGESALYRTVAQHDALFDFQRRCIN